MGWSRTLPRLVPLVIALAVTGPLAACTGKNAVDQTAGGADRFVAGSGRVSLLPVAKRRPAPVIAGRTIDGQSLSLAQFLGQVIVLNVWGSWCPPCRAETPLLVNAYGDLKSLGVTFVGVNVRDSAANARALVRTYKVPYPSLYDPSDDIPARFHDLPPAGTPSTLVIDRAGRPAASFPGPVTYSELASVVRTIAAEPT